MFYRVSRMAVTKLGLSALGALALSLAFISPASAFTTSEGGDLTVAAFDSTSIPLQITPFGVTGFPFNQDPTTVSLSQFNAAAFPAFELTEVWLTLEGSAETVISITAVGDVAVPLGSVGATIDATNFSTGPASLALNALPGGPFPAVQLLSGGVAGPLQIAGTDTSTALVSGADLAGFVGTGTFTADIAANGFFNQGTLQGGNLDTSQDTEASVVLTVQYKGVGVVPEPSSAALILAGMGMLLGTARRRRR